MSDKIIITIGRQFGSGGHALGEELAKRLGIPLYDREILEEASKKSGYSQEIFAQHDEKPTSSFLYSLALGIGGMTSSYHRPLVMEIYLAQFDAIKKLAEEGSGIFVGRCSDYVLAEQKDAFHIFVHADMNDRIKRTMKKYDVDEKKAGELCSRNDKDRASYYNYYANTTWGDSCHYDLCINTSKIDINEAADIITALIKKS